MEMEAARDQMFADLKGQKVANSIYVAAGIAKAAVQYGLQPPTNRGKAEGEEGAKSDEDV